MHVVKKGSSPEDDWQVGWTDPNYHGGTDFIVVFSSKKMADAFAICSWLNGGKEPHIEWLREKGILGEED